MAEQNSNSSDSVSNKIQALDKYLRELKLEEFKAEMSTKFNTMQNDVSSLKTQFSTMQNDVSSMKTQFNNILDSVDRLGRRVASIEDIPRFPVDVRPSAQFKATQTHGVVGAKRVNVGYTG